MSAASKKIAEKYAKAKCDTLIANIREGVSPSEKQTDLLAVPSSNLDDDRYSLNSQDSLDNIEIKNEQEDFKSEDIKKLSAKERRQLRNRISARHFRLRRKEYISQLEGLVKNMQGEIASLKKTVVELQSSNGRLNDEVVRLGGSPASAESIPGAFLSQQGTRTRKNSQHSHMGFSTGSSDDRELLSPPLGSNIVPVSPSLLSRDEPDSANYCNKAKLFYEQQIQMPSFGSALNQQTTVDNGINSYWSPEDTTVHQLRVNPQPQMAVQQHTGARYGNMVTVNQMQVNNEGSVQQAAGMNNVNIMDLSPSVASLLPVYNNRVDGPVENFAREDQLTEWPLEYPVNDIQQQSGLIQVPSAHIFQGFLPDLEKQLDILHHSESVSAAEPRNGKDKASDDEADEGHLKLALAAAEDVFKKLDAQLANMKLA